jgi:hypothetical protein
MNRKCDRRIFLSYRIWRSQIAQELYDGYVFITGVKEAKEVKRSWKAMNQ